MEESKNKTEINDSEKENKSLGKAEKTLLNEKKAENKDFPVFSENGLEKENKSENKAPKNDLEEEKTELEKFLESEGFGDLEQDNNLDFLDHNQDNANTDFGANKDDDDLGFDPDELEEISTGSDPFDELVDQDENQEPKTKTAGELKERLAGDRSSEIVEKATFLALNKVDLFKAKLCSKISGQHFMQYIGSEEEIELFIEALKSYLEKKEVKEPSPFVALMLTLGMWTLPPLGMALLERFEVFDLFKGKNKEQKQKPSTHAQEQEAEGEAASDQPKEYAHLKEFQEQRKKFTINADGKYNHTPNGKKYIPVDLANEFPSPIVQEWINEGKKNKEIIKLLDYGQ